VDDELRLDGIASLETSNPSNKANLRKKQSTIVRGTVSHIHKIEQNNVSISPFMCFSTSAIIDGPVVNGLLLVVEAFAVFFNHFFLILFLQRETNRKRDNIDNGENVRKVCTTYQGLKGHFSYDPSSTLSYQAAVDHLHAPVGTS
jgi:hypothetical protein